MIPLGYFTSEENAYGIVTLRWVEGNELRYQSFKKSKLYYYSDFSMVKYEYLMETSGCSLESNIKCASTR